MSNWLKTVLLGLVNSIANKTFGALESFDIKYPEAEEGVENIQVE